ncbi:MAG: serpin family protein [Blautia sp.]|nr:serpin family protein [Lachnoclostridium sp.]MCM1211077.1 serpin family protein [Blautia sp.]
MRREYVIRNYEQKWRRGMAFSLAAILFSTFLSGCSGDRKTSQTEGDEQDKQEMIQSVEPDAGDGKEETVPEEFELGDGMEEFETGDSVEAGTGNEESAGSENMGEPDATFCIDTADFACTLLRENLQAAEENVMVSPVSVLMALAVTANGAKGETLSQMLSVLAANQELDSLNENLRAWTDELIDEKGASLKIANSIWFDENDGQVQIETSFLDKIATFFDAEIYQEVMDENTLEKINRWVLEKTDGHIDRILDRVSKDAIMYVVNAAAFDAVWQEPYPEGQIRDGIFTDITQTKQQVSMMSSQESVYLEDENATGFLKPYQAGYRFVALLPKEGMTPEEYVKTLDGEKFLTLLSEARTGVSVLAKTPQFEAEYEIELSNILQTMGMREAFDMEKADFSGIGSAADGNFFIGRVLHKTHIAVDELGTKAGAATAVEIRSLGAVREEEIYEVCLDRPFVYAIVEDKTNVPVFIGVVNTLE